MVMRVVDLAVTRMVVQVGTGQKINPVVLDCFIEVFQQRGVGPCLVGRMQSFGLAAGPPRRAHTIASFSLRRLVDHCFNSAITTFARASSSSPAMMKSMRLDVRGTWYSIPMPTSSGISSSCRTFDISRRDSFHERTSEGLTPCPVAERKCLATTSSISSRVAWWTNWLLVA